MFSRFWGEFGLWLKDAVVAFSSARHDCSFDSEVVLSVGPRAVALSRLFLKENLGRGAQAARASWRRFERALRDFSGPRQSLCFIDGNALKPSDTFLQQRKIICTYIRV